MSTPTQDPHAADPEGQSTTTAGSCALSATHQLALQLFARVDTFAGVPPEHALFRELLDLALPAVGDGILVGTRIVTANALYSVACAIYFRKNQAGIAQVGHVRIALDARTSERTASACIAALETLGLVRTSRNRGRREIGFIEINVGGRSWYNIRERSRRQKRPKASAQLSLIEALGGSRPIDASGRDPEPITARTRGPRPVATAGQIAYAEDLGIKVGDQDVVTLGDEIERATAARQATRAANKGAVATPRSAPRSAPVERRRREAVRFGSPTPRTEATPETPAQALERWRRAMEAAEGQGWRVDPDDPGFLLHKDGRRVVYTPPE